MGWKWEAGTKSEKEKLPVPDYILDERNAQVLKKCGLINVIIKDYNHLRVQIKNIINMLTQTGFQDIKKDHLSE